VMVQGAGNRGRNELRAEAEAFARRGVVTLIYDKRTVGYSLLRRDYAVLAEDAQAGLRLLRARGDVNPARVGLWALSEGAFVAPLAANRSSDVKFLITVGAVGVTPVQQTAWSYGEYLRHAGVSGSLAPTMQVTAARMTVAAGLFPQANYDPVPAWEDLRQPVLAQWGELDREAVPQESSQLIREALDRGGNRHYTIRFVPGVRHNLNRTANDGFDRIDSLPPDYGDFEASWIDGLAAGPPAASAQPAPPHSQPSRPLTLLAWYESPWLQLAAILLLLVAFAGYPLTARRAPPARPWWRAAGPASRTLVGRHRPGHHRGFAGVPVVHAGHRGQRYRTRPGWPAGALAGPATARRRHRRGHRRHRGGLATSAPQPHRPQPPAPRRACGRRRRLRPLGGLLGPALSLGGHGATTELTGGCR
jgi:uncharacterized protein